MDATVTTFTDADSWNRALYAFLAEKEGRSGSRRTVEGYGRMLRHFFGTAGKAPDRVTGQDCDGEDGGEHLGAYQKPGV